MTGWGDLSDDSREESEGRKSCIRSEIDGQLSAPVGLLGDKKWLIDEVFGALVGLNVRSSRAHLQMADRTPVECCENRLVTESHKHFAPVELWTRLVGHFEIPFEWNSDGALVWLESH